MRMRPRLAVEVMLVVGNLRMRAEMPAAPALRLPVRLMLGAVLAQAPTQAPTQALIE